jgi:hypothetical protein
MPKPRTRAPKPAGICTFGQCKRPACGTGQKPDFCKSCAERYLSPAARIKQAYAAYKHNTAKRFGGTVLPTTEAEFTALCFHPDGKRKICMCGEISAGIDRVNKNFKDADGKLTYAGNCQALCTPMG